MQRHTARSSGSPSKHLQQAPMWGRWLDEGSWCPYQSLLQAAEQLRVCSAGCRTCTSSHASTHLTGSKTPGPLLLMLAEGSMPRLPVSIEAASLRMSPKMLPVTMVSKDFGLRMICIAALSTYLCATRTFHKLCFVPKGTKSRARSAQRLCILHARAGLAERTSVVCGNWTLLTLM